MSFTEQKIDVARLKYFKFFADGIFSLAESFNPQRDWELDKIRLRLSTIYTGTADFVVLMSHHLGSQYNELLLSDPMGSCQDLLFQPRPTLKYHYNDTLEISLPYYSPNVFGLEITGWSITTEPAA
jgi:hypothetical protein